MEVSGDDRARPDDPEIGSAASRAWTIARVSGSMGAIAHQSEVTGAQGPVRRSGPATNRPGRPEGPARARLTMSHSPVIVIGSGSAGLTAALYTARANLKPLVFEGKEPGGQLTWTTEVENFPGFPDGVQGPRADGQRIRSRPRSSAPIAGWRRWSRSTSRSGRSRVTTNDDPYNLDGKLEAEYTADALIIASGATARTLGLPDEMAYHGLRPGHLRHLRRRPLQGEEGRRRRRRRHRGRGGDLPHPPRPPGNLDPPPRQPPGLARSCRTGSSPTRRSTTPGTPSRSELPGREGAAQVVARRQVASRPRTARAAT